MTRTNAVLLGAGNLSYHLAKNLENAGIAVVCVYARNKKKAQKITSLLYNAKAKDDLDFSGFDNSLFFICVSDSAISEIAERIILPGQALLVHCSGATSLAALTRHSNAAGVFYPVQTFSVTKKISFKDVPVCIEATSENHETVLEKVAKALGARPCFMNSEQRRILHVASVIACNFTNHLLHISEHLMEENQLPFGLLNNLISETVTKAMENGPGHSQTGPAVRNDVRTLQIHSEILADHPQWQQLYRIVSDDIQRLNGKQAE